MSSDWQTGGSPPPRRSAFLGHPLLRQDAELTPRRKRSPRGKAGPARCDALVAANQRQAQPPRSDALGRWPRSFTRAHRFRRIEVDHDDDGGGFGLRINGVPVFCRGAVWTNADIMRLSGSAEDYAPWLTMAAEANMNMIRIGGTMTYESEEFFRLCDHSASWSGRT